MSTQFDNNEDVQINASFTIGTEAANVINAVIQLLDRRNGGPLAEATALPFYVASDAAGLAVSTAPDGGLAMAGGGTSGDIQEWTANISGLMIFNASGVANVALTHTGGAATFYLVLRAPDGKLLTSSAITFAA